MQPDELFDTYAKDYQEFLKNPVAEYQRSMVHALLRSMLNQNKNILDVGCGPGSDFDFYKSLSLEIDAIDISREMIHAARAHARRLGLKARIARSSLLDFIPDKLYDVIILNFGVINAFENLNDPLHKIKTILKPGGYVIIVAMPPFHLFSFLQDALKLRFSKIYKRLSQKQSRLNNGFRIYYYNENDFKSGFSIMHRENYGSLIATPEQYKNSNLARLWTKMFISMDQKYAAKMPDRFGGDHVCYVLKSQNMHKTKETQKKQ